MNKVSAVSLMIILLSLTSCVTGVLTATALAIRGLTKDETIGENIDDKVIAAKIAKEFVSCGMKEDYAKISVKVSKGRVMYVGKVNSKNSIIKAVEIAWNQSGVKEVVNNLKVEKSVSGFDASQYAEDAMITIQVVTKAIINQGIKSINYTVVTSDNVVYIFGIARSRAELEQIAELAARVYGVDKVMAEHVHILK